LNICNKNNDANKKLQLRVRNHKDFNFEYLQSQRDDVTKLSKLQTICKPMLGGSQMPTQFLAQFSQWELVGIITCENKVKTSFTWMKTSHEN